VNQKVFDEALLAVFTLMATDTLPRFRKTQQGAEIVDAILAKIQNDTPRSNQDLSDSARPSDTAYDSGDSDTASTGPSLSSRGPPSANREEKELYREKRKATI